MDILKKHISTLLRFLFPFVLGGVILYWMYRDLPFSTLSDTLYHKMRWDWMLLSFIPGILAQVFRGLRWRQALDPLDEHPKRTVCINAVFISYAVSLVIPRIGEVMRCGILKRHQDTSFSKSLGTVVTERIVDSLLILLFTGVVLLWQLPVFLQFFDITGVGFHGVLSKFTTAGILVTVICILCIIALLFVILHQLSMGKKIKDSIQNIVAGMLSLRKVQNLPLYFFYSVAIWVSYFFHYYLTVFCFDFSENIGLTAGLVSFFVGSMAGIVPTPNGAGSWHFAVKTILVLYGLSQIDAVLFALIVHTVHTLLLIALGIYGAFALQFFHKRISRKGDSL